MSFPEVPSALKTRYTVQKMVGRGGFATVYLAEDRKLERQVALKLYKPHDPSKNKRKLDLDKPIEAQLAGRVDHPNVVSIYDAGLEENRLYLVMRYLSGGSLRERITSHARPLSPTVALQLILVMAEALQEVHNARILHLDIKPENIMFDDQGRPYLTDFGIARLLDENDRAKQTYAFGSGNYAAPEQKRHGSLSTRSDIYSLGVVLFELLTGYLPLGPAPPTPEPPYSPPFTSSDTITASERLVALLCRALRADPERRFASASDFGAAIRGYIDHADEITNRLRSVRDSVAGDVHFSEPNRTFSTLDAVHHIPQSARAMKEDLVPVPARTNVQGVLYSHQGIHIGREAILNQPLFARGVVTLAQGVMAREDVISLTAIELGADVEAKNLLAPVVTLQGSGRIVGSIFCRRMGVGQGGDAPHIPAGTELGGSVVLGETFGTLLKAGDAGRPLEMAEPPQPDSGCPSLRIATDCVMVAVLGDAHVEVEPQQRQLSTIRVSGNVIVGHSNRVQRVEGHHVHIRAGCRIDEVRAHGDLVIEDGCSVGYVRAEGSITLIGDVHIRSPLLLSESGQIHIRGKGTWRDGRKRSAVTPTSVFERALGEKQGMVATALLDHTLYRLYERISPAWLPHLHPSDVAVSVAAASPPQENADLGMDLTLPEAREPEPESAAERDRVVEAQTELESDEPPTAQRHPVRRDHRG